MSSVYIWRKEYQDERPEAFSDNESNINRNRRTIAAISFSFIAFLIVTVILAIQLSFYSESLTTSKLFQRGFGLAISIIFFILLGLVMLKIKRNEER